MSSISRSYFCKYCGAKLSAQGMPCGTPGCPGNISNMVTTETQGSSTAKVSTNGTT